MNVIDGNNSVVIRRVPKFIFSILLFAFLLCTLPGYSVAATAIDDRYTLRNTGGSETLVITYNDRIQLATPDQIAVAGLISVSALSDPGAGSVALDTDDERIYAVNFRPNPAFTGAVSFTYTVRDIRGDSSATVTIDLVAGAEQLVVNGDSFTSAGEPIVIYPLENDNLLTTQIPSISFTQPDIGSVTTEGAITGALLYTPPDTITGLTETDLTYTVSYGDGSSATGLVRIRIDPGLDPISEGIDQDDQQELAEVLQIACDANSLSPDQDTDLTTTCNTLEGLDADDRSEALERILLRQIGAQSSSLENQQANQIDLVSSRLHTLRSGSTGLNFAGLGATLGGEWLPLGDLLDGYVSGAGAGDNGSGGRLGAFITGTIEIGEGETRGLEKSFDYDAQQILGGIDYRFSDAVVLGVALGLDSTETKADNGATQLEKDGATVSLYGNYYPTNDWYVDWLLGYGQSTIDTRRELAIGTEPSVSNGNTDGHHTSATIGTGYTYQFDAWAINGYITADYRTVRVDSYEEDNDAGLSLLVSATSIDTLTAQLGARISRALSLDFGVLIPQFELEAVNQIRNEAPRMEAVLKDVPEAGSFSLQNQEPDDSYYNVGLSLTALFKNGFSGFISYRNNLARDDISIQSWQGGARLEFGGPSKDITLFQSREDQGTGFGLFAGTTGLGLALSLPLRNEYLNLRGVLATLDYDTDRDLDGIVYDVNLDLRSGGLLLDLHPFGGGFRISGGVFALKHDFKGTATPEQEVELGDEIFTPEEAGTLTAIVGYDRSFAPYLGLGWGNAVAPASRLSFAADIGVMFTDNPTIDLTADSPLADSNPALKAELLTELEKEEDAINEEDLGDIDLWPVITLGVSYHF